MSNPVLTGCFYISIGAQAFGATQSIPMVVLVILFVATWLSRNPLWALMGFALYFAQYDIWCFQHYFQQIRPDPVCQLYQSFAFPSLEAFYAGAAFGIFIAYSHIRRIAQSWLLWFLFIAVVIVLPCILLYTNYNRWWEVLFSQGFGILTGILFVFVLEWFIIPRRRYLQNSFPLYHFGYVPDESDTKFYLMGKGLRFLNDYDYSSTG